MCCDLRKGSILRCVAPVCHPTAGCGETAYKLGDYFNLIPQVFCHGEHPKPPQLELGTKCDMPASSAAGTGGIRGRELRHRRADDSLDRSRRLLWHD